MKKIESFQVDHTKLLAGLYLSRKDVCKGTTVTTFDLRFTAPNREPVMEISGMHTIEHLGATFLRNSVRQEEIVYFGPMGCRTGFYLVVFGDKQSQDVLPIVMEMCDFIEAFEGDIPGATPKECGNWSDQNLALAKQYVAHYKKQLLENKRLCYQQ